MTASAQQRTWGWDFQAPVAEVWAHMADTARFNEAAGLPRQVIVETPQPDGSVLYDAKAKIGPFRLFWREVPVNWVAPHWLEHRRVFKSGPFAFLTARLVFTAQGEDACRLEVTVSVAPRNLVGRMMLATRFFPSTERMYGDQVAAVQGFLDGENDRAFTYEAPKPTPAALERAEQMRLALEQSGHGHGLGQRLIDHIFGAQETELVHLRPLALARLWSQAERHVIELCLEATRQGLLEMRWTVLCPRCRISKAASSGLDKLPRGAHCGTCNIDYDSDFSKNVELSFQPAPSLRELTFGEFCLFGPGSTPHIWLQVALDPGASQRHAAELPAGRYCLRSLEPGQALEIAHDGGAFPAFILTDDGMTAGPKAPPGEVVLENRGTRPRVMIVEEQSWVRDALTADRVTSLQAFRDPFSDQVLRPGDEVAVRRIALLFTDLRGSTQLYNEVGDAAAYHLVREHFAFLTAIVREHDGALVKTIGDAVMASFTEPLKALDAAIAVQSRVAAFNAGQESVGIVIKLGLHMGPTIAVTLNERFDYFGATVNLAARLEAQSFGGDIVLSEAIVGDPAVAQRLDGHRLDHEQSTLKGFESPVGFYRLSHPEDAPPSQ